MKPVSYSSTYKISPATDAGFLNQGHVSWQKLKVQWIWCWSALQEWPQTAKPEIDNEDLIKTGMRLAADFLNQKETDLAQLLGAQPPKDQMSVRKGMAQTLLRNIVLPSDEQLQASGKLALKAFLSLGGENREIQSICQELTQILEQYGQHKEQMTQQLEDAIRAQLEQQQMSQEAGKPITCQPGDAPEIQRRTGENVNQP